MNTMKKYIDVNNVHSIDHLKQDREIIGSYITTYFSQYINSDWVLMEEKINKIASNASTVLLNYNENINLIGTQNFKNDILSSIDKIIEESEVLNGDIYTLTEKMKDTLMKILVKNDSALKDKYIN